jgi:hypothetical protein
MIATAPQLQPRVDLDDLAEHLRSVSLAEVERNGVAILVDSLSGVMEIGTGRLGQFAVALRVFADRLGERQATQTRQPNVDELAQRSRIRRMFEACPNVGDSVKLMDVFPPGAKYRELIAIAVATGDWDIRRERRGEKAAGMPPWWATRIR